MGLNGYLRIAGLALAIFICLLAASNCGGRQGKSLGMLSLGGSSPESEVSLDEALAEIGALEAPVGVNAALFQQLKDELARQLRAKGVSKFASKPPTGEASRVDDLAITDNGDGTYALTWHYRSPGDYDQNGEVGIDDINPIATHFGTAWEAGEENTLPAVVDGSGNYQVGIEDVTPLAINFLTDCAGYFVQGADDIGGPWTTDAEIAIAEAGANGRLFFSVPYAAFGYAFYRVVPVDGAGAEGIASNTAGAPPVIASVSPVEGVADTDVEFSAVVAGAPPFAYAWDLGGGAAPNTSEEEAPTVTLGAAGSYAASLTVTSDYGAATYDFTLTVTAAPMPPVITGVSPNEGFAGSDVTFSAAVTGTPPMSYAWDFGGGASPNTSEEEAPTVTLGAVGSYEASLTVTSDYGADTFYFTLIITVAPQLPAISEVTSTGVLEGSVVTFNATVTGTPPLIYAWDFGGGAAPNTSAEEEPTVTLGAAGSYLASLTVTNPYGSDVFHFNLNVTALPATWVHTLGGNAWDVAHASAVDGNGNIYVAGLTFSFGAGSGDAFLLQYSSEGALQWQKTWGGSGYEYARGVAVDEIGNVYVTGMTDSFGAGSGDSFLLQYSSEGDLQWQKTWGGSSGDVSNALVVDGNGNVYVAGSTTSFPRVQNDFSYAFLLQYSPDGTLQWQKTWGGNGADSVNGLAVDPEGNVYAAGTTRSFGAASTDAFLLQYSSEGVLQWEKTWRGSGYDEANSVAVSAGGDAVYVAGTTESFGAGSADALLLQYSPSGNLLLQAAWGRSDSDSAYGVALDDEGNVYLSGFSFGAGARRNDVLLLKYSPDNTLLWEKIWGGSAYYEGSYCVTVEGSGKLVLVGVAPNAYGYWDTPSGTATSPNGSDGTPSGVVRTPSGSENTPSGTETAPSGTEDSGGGSGDTLTMKIDPLMW